MIPSRSALRKLYRKLMSHDVIVYTDVLLTGTADCNNGCKHKHALYMGFDFHQTIVIGLKFQVMVTSDIEVPSDSLGGDRMCS